MVYPCVYAAKALDERRIRMIRLCLGKTPACRVSYARAACQAGLPEASSPKKKSGGQVIPPGGGPWQKPKQVLINAVWQAFISTLINPGLWGAPAGGNRHRRAGLLADKLQVDGVEAF